ncbi:divalent-cation tolerance protein CutA [archaeon SCG-AAA382B04]|nr:divalent-cation tolerance protein CutA [archaeon SCG-AAA382B04]
MQKIGYITSRDKEEAKQIGERLIKEQLVACVNYLGEIETTYWWNKQIQNDDEYSFIIKTNEENVDEIIEKVKNLHSYENPCIVFVDIDSGSEKYLQWIDDYTKN